MLHHQTTYHASFISQLQTGSLSSAGNAIIDQCSQATKVYLVNSHPTASTQNMVQFLTNRTWSTPTYADYSQLLKTSEYAAWVLVHGNRCNHYTLAIHNLAAPVNKIAQFNALVKTTGIVLNGSGGDIKTSEDGLLMQSATLAEQDTITFADGSKHEVAGSFVEFAERSVLPEFAHLPITTLTRAHRRDGFETGNADKIFESTYRQ